VSGSGPLLLLIEGGQRYRRVLPPARLPPDLI